MPHLSTTERLPPGLALGNDTRYWQTVSNLVLETLARHKLLPVLAPANAGASHFHARWLPVLDDSYDAPRLARRHSLDRWLPLRFLGGQPVRDASRPSVPPTDVSAGARQLRRFLLTCSDRRSMVLSVATVRTSDPLSRALVEELRRSLAPPRPPCPGTGGLLLLLDAKDPG